MIQAVEAAPHDLSLPITFTEFQSHGSILSKKYHLNAEGNIIKTPSAQMYAGTALRKTMDFSGFPMALSSADHYVAFGYGVYSDDIKGPIKIVTANKANAINGSIARTRDYFSFSDSPGILLLDYDPSDQGVAIESPDQLIEILTTIDQQFKSIAYCARGSLSAGVHKTGELPYPSQGIHLYIPIKRSSDLPRIGSILFKRLWLAGFGHIDISNSGAILARTIIDASIFSPERLDFVGKPIVDQGLAWSKPALVYRTGDYLDSEQIHDLTPQEETLVAQLQAIAKSKVSVVAKNISLEWKQKKISALIDQRVPVESAEQQILGIVDGENTVLPMEFILHFDNLGAVTVSEVLANLDAYDKETLADPFEPEKGRRKAKFWSNAPNGVPLIHSFVHGGFKYFFPCPNVSACKSVIQLITGNKPLIVDECEKVLIKAGMTYVYAGMLVRLVPISSRDSKDRLAIVPVDPVFLVDHLMQHAKFEKYKPTQKAWVEADLPQDYAVTLLARKTWDLPSLTGVINTPTLRLDGSILEASGYDSQTRLYADFDSSQFQPIPVSPTKIDVANAIDTLLEPLKGFSFEHEYDLATAIAAIFTALVRKSINNAPMFLFNSPKMGAGKGLLVDMISILATGFPCAPMSQSANPDEERKRLLAFLLEGASIFCIDNIEKQLESDTLCTVLTMSELKDRILGKTQMVSVSTQATFLGTGNGVSVTGDLVRRVLPCNTDPQVESPHERRFDTHLPTFVKTQRPKLVHAALTILRAYHAAGKPNQNLKPFGSFEQWSDFVRSALVWSGFDDPCKSLVRWKHVDPVRSDLTNVLESWHGSLGNEAYTVERLVDIAQSVGYSRLEKALLDIAGQHGLINRRILGRWLVRFTNRIEAGYKLELAGQSGTRNKYRVVKP